MKILKIILIILFIGVLAIVGTSLLLDNSSGTGGTSADKNDNEENIAYPDLFCQYTKRQNLEYSDGRLKIFIKTEDGYINYNLVRTVNSARNADIWRMSQAFWYSDDLEENYSITTSGAEWDMAIKLSGASDFIGGYAHGDEIMTDVIFEIDGVETDITTLVDITEFTTIKVYVNSIGYNPDNQTEEALKHYKEFTIDKHGVKLYQKVEWLNDYSIPSGNSHLAMMPPLKTLSNMCKLDNNSPYSVPPYRTWQRCKKALVYGVESGFYFEMSVPLSPFMTEQGTLFIMSDNGGNNYNKMYYSVELNCNVKKGDIWEQITQWNITKK